MKALRADRPGEPRFAPLFKRQRNLRRLDLQVAAKYAAQQRPPRDEMLPVALEMEAGRARPFLGVQQRQAGRIIGLSAPQRSAPHMNLVLRQIELARGQGPA